MPQRESGPQAAGALVSFMEIDGGGEGAEAGVSRSAAAAEALPSPSPSPSAPSKRTRVAAPAAPQAQAQGQGQEQASADRAPATTTTTTTTTTTASSMRGRSRAAVVSSRELMERVLAFVAGGSREAREDVGRAAVVCRVWREAAYGAEVWGCMASEVLPVVGAGGLGLGRDGRAYVVEVGRCVAERRVRWGDDWWEGLRLHVEVWDGRDGLRMLSVEGRFDVNVNGGYTFLEVTGLDRHEVVGPAFSAASRDPEHPRFEDVRDYFRRAHEEGTPGELCTRAVVRDVRSGRRALLWESGKGQRWAALYVPPTDRFSPFLPEGSLVIATMSGADHSIVYPRCGTEEAAVRMGLDFNVRPEAGQEGVPARDKLWRLAGADAEHYGEHKCFLIISFRNSNRDETGRFIWSLLCAARG
jgi:hypothetical protein